ncbi:MAG: LysM peptidoglycan-binding domain-containing protein [Thermoleophilia bacterium]
MDALRPTPLRGLLLLAAGLAILLVTGLGSASAATVTVRAGDTLGAIAARNGTTVSALAAANGIADPNVIVAGRRLTIPGGGGAAAAPSGGGWTAAGRTHVIRPGDTLSAIAAANGTTVGAIVRANGIADPNRVAVGRRLTIPGGGAGGTVPAGMTPVGGQGSGGSGGAYVVRSGDTLSGIAARHGTTVAAIVALNGIADPDNVPVGRRLTVPGASPAGNAQAPTDPVQVAALLADASARHGVDPALARAIAWQESRWTQSARSSAGAIGVMQLMPATAKWLGASVLGRPIQPRNLEDNIEGGVAYLAWLQRQGVGTRTVIGAYYQGLAGMRRHGPYDDTRDYIASVLSFRGRV